MIRSIVIAIVLCTVALPAARADLPVGAFAPDIEAKEWLNTEEPVSLRDARGMVVVLFFWVSFHQGGANVMDLINIVENNRQFGRERGVMVIGLTDSDRKRTEDLVKENKLFFPIGLESKSDDEYRIESFPRVVIIDSDGKVAWSGWPAENGGIQLRDALLETLSKTPPTRTHPKEASKVRAHLDDARAALRAGKYRDAFEAARDAYEKALTGDSLKVTCREFLDLIDALGRDQLAEAEKELDAKNFPRAVELMRAVMRNFRGTDSEKTAKQKLETAGKAHEDVARLLKSQEQDARARGNLKKARDAVTARRFGEGYEILDSIVRESADSEVAASAEEMLERMRKNEAVMRDVRDYLAKRDCEGWLGQARTFIRANRVDKARELLRKVIDQYPDSRYASDAYAELSKLPP